LDCTGRRQFLTGALKHANFTAIEGDVLNVHRLGESARGADIVFHLAANADVRFGTENPRKDLEQNTIAAFNILEAMRANGIKTIAFASTGSIYGQAEVIPTPEDAPFPVQTSLYGASKLAGEGLIAAYAEGFGMRGYIFRFASILGQRYTHGHVFDFVQKLGQDPSTLEILGNGLQRKSYLHVDDCVEGMLTAIEQADDKINIFNLGNDEYCQVKESAGRIADRLGVEPAFAFTGGDRGWIGDNPFIFLDTRRIRALGWRPKLSIRESVELTVDWLKANEWVFSSGERTKPMTSVCVVGLWHLGCVTAACIAEAGYRTIGIDYDPKVVTNLQEGRAPLFEPGLDDLISRGLAHGRLTFSGNPAEAASCDLVWIALDTPVDNDDVADTGVVYAAAEKLFPYLKDDAVVLISSQLPVGSTRAMAKAFSAAYPQKACNFACAPENLRLGKSIEIFKDSERIIVGCQEERVRQLLRPILEKFTRQIVWMSIESAEMVKHGVNAFLAMCVTFANELAIVCERVGADAAEVEGALRLEPRIGPRAYIKPGAAFAGGTLARDIVFLNTIAKQEGLRLPLLDAVLPSNKAHKHWPVRRILDRLGNLAGRTVAVLGLAYKPGTDTLRRSSAIELCRELADLKANVRAFDPAVRDLPTELKSFVTLAPSAEAALAGADAAIVATEWPEFRSIALTTWRDAMRAPLICDPNGFLAKTFEDSELSGYMRVGRP
jgi:UDPglucose 6-dehydrogenase